MNIEIIKKGEGMYFIRYKDDIKKLNRFVENIFNIYLNSKDNKLIINSIKGSIKNEGIYINNKEYNNLIKFLRKQKIENIKNEL